MDSINVSSLNRCFQNIHVYRTPLKFGKKKWIIDPACQNINTKDNCYVMDPSCPSVLPDDIRCTNSDDAIVYACSILGGVIVLLIAVLIIIIIRYRENICTCLPGTSCKHYIYVHNSNVT